MESIRESVSKLEDKAESVHGLNYAPRPLNKNWKKITRRGLEAIAGGVVCYLVAGEVLEIVNGPFQSYDNIVSAIMDYGRRMENNFYKVVVGCGGAAIAPAIDWLVSRRVKN